MFQDVTAWLEQAVRAQVCSGAALAVAWPGGREVHHVGRTARLPEPGEVVGPGTQFDLASLTKPLVSLTILTQLLGEGRLTLADRLDLHLHEAAGTPLGQATLGQLASHAAGAPAWLDFWQRTQPGPDRRAEVLRRVLGTAPESTPGTRATYSDLGYIALGAMLEAVLGQPLDVLYAQRVAAPLGLGATYRRLSQPRETKDVVATEVWPPRCPDGLPLRGLVHDDNAAAMDGVAGHAGLFASAEDVLTQGQAWLAAWQGDPGPLHLDPALVRRLTTTSGAPATTWRHGWDTPTRPGSTAGDRVPDGAFGHLGFTGTSLWLAPHQGSVVVLLTNRVHPDRGPTEGIRALRRAVHDAVWERVQARAP
jgi:CubicO group peptidase (beta-lactamase class C family)